MDAAERVSRRSSRPPSPVRREEEELDLRDLLKVLQGIRDGDFSVRLPGDRTGLSGKVADVINEIAATNQRLAREVERAGQLVGKEGRTRHRITTERRSGSWGAMESALNTLIDDLVWPTAETTRTRPLRSPVSSAGSTVEGSRPPRLSVVNGPCAGVGSP